MDVVGVGLTWWLLGVAVVVFVRDRVGGVGLLLSGRVVVEVGIGRRLD